MAQKKKMDLSAAMAEVADLKEKFETIKGDTLQFLERSKKLSNMGIKEAHELLTKAKGNWENIASHFNVSGLGHLFGKAGKKARRAKAPGRAKSTKAKSTSKAKVKRPASKSRKKAR